MAADPFADLLALPGVFDAVEGARAAVDGLLREPALRRRPPEISVEALRRGAWASAVLDGVEIERDDFRVPLPEALPDDQRALAQASLRLSAEVGGLVPVWRRAPLQALARLHAVAASGVLGMDDAGRPRPDRHVSARLSWLASAVTVPTQAPAVLIGAVVHGELLVLDAFAWGNGLVARAAQRLVLLDRGVDPAAVSIPEEGVLAAGPAEYVQAARAYADGSPEGTAGWLCFVAETVARGAVAGRAALAAR